jgi:hypothetical protein
MTAYSRTADGWLRTWANDIESGDVIRAVGDTTEYRIAGRDEPDPTASWLGVWFDDGSTMMLGKFAKVEIYDPQGFVAERIRRQYGHLVGEA